VRGHMSLPVHVGEVEKWGDKGRRREGTCRPRAQPRGAWRAAQGQASLGGQGRGAVAGQAIAYPRREGAGLMHPRLRAACLPSSVEHRAPPANQCTCEVVQKEYYAVCFRARARLGCNVCTYCLLCDAMRGL